MNHDIRQNLEALIRSTPGEGYASISRMLGRNAAYIQQFIKRGAPERLDEADRKLIARYFGADPDTLYKAELKPRLATVQVPQLSVQASAGNGRIVEDEFVIGSYGFDRNWLRQVAQAEPADLSIVKVSGDSMAPTLVDGDDVLVDRSDRGQQRGQRLRDGIYVLRRDDTLLVKRLALAPTSGTLTISSDNPAYPSWRDCPLDSVDVLGRVVWAGRRLG